jgi:hypothetical protein
VRKGLSNKVFQADESLTAIQRAVVVARGSDQGKGCSWKPSWGKTGPTPEDAFSASLSTVYTN